MNIHCVVSGQSFYVNAENDTRIGELRMLALIEADQLVASSREWEVRNVDGDLLVGSNTINHSDLFDGSTVYVSPRAGIGA